MHLLIFPLVAGCVPTDDKPATDAADTDTDTDADTDSDTDADTDADTDTDANQAPSTAPEIAFSPPVPAQGQEFSVTIVTPSVDPDGDAVSYRYAWTVDGVASANTTEIVQAGDTADGQTWGVTVTPTDGSLDGPAATGSVVIGNAPPTAPVLHIDPAEPQRGDTLTLVYDTAATDPDGDTLTTSITWYVDGSEALPFADLTEVDGAHVDGNEVFRAVVSVTDGVNTPVTAEASVTVANTVPSLTTPSISPATPKDDDDLTVSARGVDPDGGRLTYHYTWYRDGVEATDVGDTDTVPASATTVGEEWTAAVTVSDGVDTATDSAAPVTIEDWEGYTYTHRFTATLVNDGTGAFPTSTGTWSYDLLSQGGWMGDSACTLEWDFDATSAPGVCPRCDYAFSVNYTLDTSVSGGTGSTCTADMADGLGTWAFTAARNAVEAYNYPFGSSTSGYYGYYYGGIWLYVAGTGGYSSSYYGYTWTNYYSVTTTEDSAGNITIDAYSYQSSRY